MAIMHHVKHLMLNKSLRLLIGSALIVSVLIISTIDIREGETKAPTKSFDLTGVWMDIWRDEIHLWHENGKLVGAYTWQGTPAAIIGLVNSESLSIRYYQAIGHSGDARCFIRKNGDQLDCEYLSHDGEEKGKWVMVRIPEGKAL